MCFLDYFLFLFSNIFVKTIKRFTIGARGSAIQKGKRCLCSHFIKIKIKPQ